MEQVKTNLELPELTQAPPAPPPPPVLPDSVFSLAVALAQRKINPESRDKITFHLDESTRDLVVTNTEAMVGNMAYNVRFPAPHPHLHGDLDAIADFIHTLESHAPMMHNPPITHLMPKPEIETPTTDEVAGV